MSKPEPPYHPPPKWVDKILERFCAPELLEEVLGDLHERYYLRVQKEGVKKAKKGYWQEVLAYVRPSVFKRSQYHHSVNHKAMLKNYLKIAFRNLAKYKAFSFINIVGLTVGISCCLLLFLYIQDELSYDQHHTHAPNLYRITTHFNNSGGMTEDLPTASPPIAMAMWSEFPEVVKATRVVSHPGIDFYQIYYQEKSFSEDKGLIVDSTFFEMFNYQFSAGNPQKALSQPNTVVLTQKLARKLFDESRGLGEIIRIGTDDYEVTGVLEENRQRTHIEANFFTSMTSKGIGQYVINSDQWAGNNFVFSYLQLNPNASPEALVAKFPDFLNKYGAESLKAMGMSKSMHLQAVTDIHLRSNYEVELGTNGSIIFIYVLSMIAIFILLIACVNFINLSTAKASQRASEVGVRKTLGASQPLLIRQFLAESMLIVGLAVLLSALLAGGLLPFLNSLTGKTIGLSAIHWAYYGLAAGVITLFVGLLAGTYPAFFLSSFQPAKVLKGKGMMRGSSGWLRKGLVVFQFAIAICLIFGVVVILSQLDYMQRQYLGFETTSRIVLPLHSSEASQHYQELKNKLNQQAEIRKVSATSVIPGRKVVNDLRLYSTGSDMENAIYCQRYFVDNDFVDVLQLQLLEGRNFDASSSEHEDNPILINQLALKNLGISQDEAIGKQLHFDYEETTYSFEIIGVVNDFHQLSLHQPIAPMLFQPGDADVYSYLVAAVHPASMNQVLPIVEDIWQETVANLPFDYTLLDQQVQSQYESDRTTMQVIGSFTLIAIFISCLGLYGLSAFIAERKVKEIGIRKVLGARVSGIVGLLSRDFTKLVLIAFVISVPLSYYVMNHWLESFAYRIDIKPQFFVVAGLIALVVAWSTISYHAIKAALTNPVDSLRNE